MTKNKEKNTNKSFFIIQLIFAIIISGFIFGLYFFVLETSYEDPIAIEKNNVLTLQLVMIGISLIITLLITIFTRDKKKLIQKFKLIVIISILMIITQFTIKIYMDSQYNEEVFEQFYEQTNPDSENKKGITLGLYGVRISSEKESYVQKSVALYNLFKIKTLLYIIIHSIFVILIIYLTIKLIMIEEKRDRIAKDDIIFGEKKWKKYKS